jgi:hypothetical protein
MASRPLYRARQFFGALQPRVRRSELRAARELLGPQLTPLFLSMSRRDQRHCLDVCATLRTWGCEDGDVLTAALLHDAGKGSMAAGRVRLWHRVTYVLLEAGAPSMIRPLSRYSRGLRALRRHGERGVMLVEALGGPAEVVRLLREMERSGTADSRALLLREADESS